jgi:hypothetical protein
MSIWGKLIGGGASQMMDSASGLATSLRSALTGELPPDLREKIKSALIQLDKIQLEGAISIQKAALATGSLFLAGWRPFLGWVCGISIAINFAILAVANVLSIWGIQMTLTQIGLSEAITLIVTLLGLGGMRSYEKRHKVNNDH